jgi:hypothetical protein
MGGLPEHWSQERFLVGWDVGPGVLPILTAALFLLYHAGLVGSAGTRLQGTAPLEGVRPGLLPILSAAGSLGRYSREARRSRSCCSTSRSRVSVRATRRSPSGPPCLLARSLTCSSRVR